MLGVLVGCLLIRVELVIVCVQTHTPNMLTGDSGSRCSYSPNTAWTMNCRHLDADEAIVRGAAFYAANLSTTFRLAKKFGMADGIVYPVTFQVTFFHYEWAPLALLLLHVWNSVMALQLVDISCLQCLVNS